MCNDSHTDPQDNRHHGAVILNSDPLRATHKTSEAAWEVQRDRLAILQELSAAECAERGGGGRGWRGGGDALSWVF